MWKCVTVRICYNWGSCIKDLVFLFFFKIDYSRNSKNVIGEKKVTLIQWSLRNMLWLMQRITLIDFLLQKIRKSVAEEIDTLLKPKKKLDCVAKKLLRCRIRGGASFLDCQDTLEMLQVIRRWLCSKERYFLTT